MKKLILIYLSCITIGVSLSTNLFSQVLFKAEVKNQVLDRTNLTYGPCVFFDVYLTENTGSSGPLYLADADFWFHFNVSNFTTPAFEYVPGTSVLHNSLGGLTSFYDGGMGGVFISPNKLVINIPGPTPGTQAQFNSTVAKIDATPNTHKLGQFVVYTSKLSGTFGLTWITGTSGTVVTSMLPVSPWSSSPATGTLLTVPDLPLPVENIEVHVPTEYNISQNYPNPFNPTTKIEFALPFDSYVTLKLYDISGREVLTLLEETKAAGYYTKQVNGDNLSSGMYFYRIVAESNKQKFVMTKKMILLK
jgi:hypothetical protein